MDREKRGPDNAVAVRVCALALERSGSHFRLEEGVAGAAHLASAASILDDRFLAAFPSAAEMLLQEYRDCRRSQCAQLLAGACARQGWVHLLSALEVPPLLSARIPCDQYRALLARAEAEGDARLAAHEEDDRAPRLC